MLTVHTSSRKRLTHYFKPNITENFPLGRSCPETHWNPARSLTRSSWTRERGRDSKTLCRICQAISINCKTLESKNQLFSIFKRFQLLISHLTRCGLEHKSIDIMFLYLNITFRCAK